MFVLLALLFPTWLLTGGDLPILVIMIAIPVLSVAQSSEYCKNGYKNLVRVAHTVLLLDSIIATTNLKRSQEQLEGSCRSILHGR